MITVLNSNLILLPFLKFGMSVICEHYVLEINRRQANERGGGLRAYIHNILNYVLLDYNVTHTESLWLRINQNCFERIVKYNFIVNQILMLISFNKFDIIALSQVWNVSNM